MLYTHLITLVATLAAASPVIVPQKRDIIAIPLRGRINTAHTGADLVIDNGSLGTPGVPEDSTSFVSRTGIMVTPGTSDCNMVKIEPSAWTLANQTKSSTLVTKGTVLLHEVYNATFYSDVLSVGAYTANVTYPGDMIDNTSPVIGLGLHPSYDVGQDPPFFSAAQELGFFVERSLFGVSNKSDYGSLAVGGPDSKCYTGDISYNPVLNASLPGFNIALESVTINGERIARNASAEISFDYSILAPEDIVSKIYANIPGATKSKMLMAPNAKNPSGIPVDTYTIPCNPAPNVSVSVAFAGQSYAIPAVDLIAGYEVNRTGMVVQWTVSEALPEDYTRRCVGAFQPSESNTWVIGRAFLANVYTTLRYDPPSVGFAQLHPSVQTNITAIPEPWTRKPSVAMRLDAAIGVVALASMFAVLF